MSERNRTDSWLFRSLPGWYRNAELAAPMHQDFEVYEELEATEKRIRAALDEGAKLARDYERRIRPLVRVYR